MNYVKGKVLPQLNHSKEPQKSSLGKVIRAHRAARHWTQKDFANRIAEETGEEKTSAMVSQWERDEATPSLPNLLALTRVLGISLSEFLGQTGLETGNRAEAVLEVRQAVGTYEKNPPELRRLLHRVESIYHSVKREMLLSVLTSLLKSLEKELQSESSEESKKRVQ